MADAACRRHPCRLGLLTSIQFPVASSNAYWRGAVLGIASLVAWSACQATPRIISLSPHLTEIAFVAGAGESLVGAVEYSDYPGAALSIPRVGNAFHLDYERIIELNPDVVLVWSAGITDRALRHLERLGIRMHRSNPTGLESIAADIRSIGELAGTGRVAERVSEAYLARLSALRQKHNARLPVAVFVQLSAAPLFTVGGPHIISEAVSLCGGQNVFSGLNVLAPAVDRESVIIASPEVIIADSEAALSQWRDWPEVKAVRNAHLYVIDPDLLHRATPRMLDGVALLCELIEKARGSRR